MPLVDFGDDAEAAASFASAGDAQAQARTSGRSTARLPRHSKLQRFLQDLALKPSGADPTLDEVVEDLLLGPDEAGEQDDGLGFGGSVSLGAGETFGSSGDSASAGAAAAGAGAGAGAGGDAAGGARRRRARERRRNPEADSFAYIEMLLESLSALGKLGYAVDALGQRVQGEMFALVEATVDEVEERCVILSCSFGCCIIASNCRAAWRRRSRRSRASQERLVQDVRQHHWRRPARLLTLQPSVSEPQRVRLAIPRLVLVCRRCRRYRVLGDRRRSGAPATQRERDQHAREQRRDAPRLVLDALQQDGRRAAGLQGRIRGGSEDRRGASRRRRPSPSLSSLQPGRIR